MSCLTEKCKKCFNSNYDGCALMSVPCDYDEKLSRRELTQEIYDLMDSNLSEENGALYNRGLEQVLAIIGRKCLRERANV